MKKTIAILLTSFMILSLTACAGGTTAPETTSSTKTDAEENASEEITSIEAEEAEEIIEYKLGETVSTDTTDFILESAVFTIACNNSNGDDYLLPVEYENGSNNPFVAAVGETLVALTFKITNNNRVSADIASGSFSSDKATWCFDWNVEYKGELYHLGGQRNDHYLQFAYAYLSSDGANWEKSDTDNAILQPGESITVRTYGTIATDVNDLKDGFKLIINMPSSKGFEKVTYVID